MKDLKLLVILNDNDCSISPPVGGLSKHFTRLMSGQFYAQARDLGKSIVRPFPKLFELTKRAEEYSKGIVAPNSTLFEEFGLNYHGPIDGHDLDALIPVLQNMKELKGPLVLHVVTQKGYGYAPAEHNPTMYHGISPFDCKVGLKNTPHALTFTEIFSQWVCRKAREDEKLVAITPAMKEGSGLVEFAKEFPDRFFDVAIAEQHAATFAAGLAIDGLKPVLALYSTFAQRAYDQIIHDICIQNLPVLIALDRGGLVGADGATHHGSLDISFFRCIPNLTIAVPSDENECWHMLETGYAMNSPVVVRYPRGKGLQVPIVKNGEVIPVGKSRIVRQGSAAQGRRVAFFAFGPIIRTALEAAEKLNATVCDMRFVKPLDRDALVQLAQTHDLLVTIEENAVMGGAGSAAAEAFIEQGMSPKMLLLGLPDRFVTHGSQEELLKECRLDAESVVERVQAALEK
jgi:1-deoxy-D-xylulose-5-phosphate synthase